MTIDTIHQFEKAEILVTGGAGFIGSNLCESLLQQGAHVTCLDNFSTGKEQNIEGFKDLSLIHISEPRDQRGSRMPSSA